MCAISKKKKKIYYIKTAKMSQSKGAHEQGQKWEPCSFNIVYHSSNAYARYHLSEEGRLFFAPEIVPRKGISGIFLETYHQKSILRHLSF